MRTLYVSDLDGTLLDKNVTLSDYAVENLNNLIADDVNFTVATARTAVSAVKILSEIETKIPIILMNGVLIYDTNKKEYVNKELLDKTLVQKIIETLHKCGQTGFMYGIKDNELRTYFEHLDRPPHREFYDERVKKYYKNFSKVAHFSEVDDSDIIYFALLDNYERMASIYSELKKIDGLGSVMYKDIYDENLWYIECYSKAASKYNAVKFLRENYGYDKIIGFGDNLNDIPLFDACDECYAVQNAKEELKEMATDIIDSNENDGVVKWLIGSAKK